MYYCINAITDDYTTEIAVEPEIPGANISSISVHRLIVAANSAKYFTSIGRVVTPAAIHCTNVLFNFKIDYQAYVDLKYEDAPKAPSINDKDNDRKVIKWASILQDWLARTYGSRGPLIYVLRENSDVPTEVDDPLDADSY